jgi:thiol-disulfide isomerase/thioredoxin
MKKCLVCLTLFGLLRLPDCMGQASLPYFNEKDSIHITGKILDFKSGQGNDFISFLTFGIDGKSKKESFQVLPDGSFDVTIYQGFEGDISVSYRTAFASLYTRPGAHLDIQIENRAVHEGKRGKEVFLATGELSEVNNLLFDFQSEIREHDFNHQANLGDKQLSDSAFADHRHKRLTEELEFLESFISSRKTQNREFSDWQRNQLVYAAGQEILMFPFFGKMNTTISDRQLLDLISFIPIGNSLALHNSAYYDFLNILAIGCQIIVNINPAYSDARKENGNNSTPVVLAQLDKLTTGITREILYFDLYASLFLSPSGKKTTVAGSDRFEAVIREPYLKKKFKELQDSINDDFQPYNIVDRIRNLKVSPELKTRLLHTFEKTIGGNIFIDFWGDWCGPCMLEMPAYPELIGKFEARPLKFVFFSAHTSDKSVQRVKEKYKINADFINLTNDEVAMMNNVFEFHAYPSHFVVNSKGYVVGNHTKRAEDIERLITK